MNIWLKGTYYTDLRSSYCDTNAILEEMFVKQTALSYKKALNISNYSIKGAAAFEYDAYHNIVLTKMRHKTEFKKGIGCY